MANSDVPVLFTRREDCCGCTACCSVCPKDAIEMKEDDEGFDYPCINPLLCVGCGMCLAVCPMKKSESR
jgi:formate hydrogenlyase subunit 6/NADH:ubiquinone oxidoreductase subunit I